MRYFITGTVFQTPVVFLLPAASDFSEPGSVRSHTDLHRRTDLSSRRFLFLSNESGFRTAFPHGSCRARFRSMSAQALHRREPPSYTGSVRSCKRPSLSVQIPAFPEWQLSKEDPPVPGIPFPRSRTLCPSPIPAGIFTFNVCVAVL